MRKSIDQEAASLRDEICEHDRHYYVDAAPIISDQEYEKLLAELRDLETAHPELVTRSNRVRTVIAPAHSIVAFRRDRSRDFTPTIPLATAAR